MEPPKQLDVMKFVKENDEKLQRHNEKMKEIEKRERETHGTGDLGQSFGCDGHSGDPCQFPRKVGEAYQEYAAVCLDVQDRKEHYCACWWEDGLCTSHEAGWWYSNEESLECFSFRRERDRLFHEETDWIWRRGGGRNDVLGYRGVPFGRHLSSGYFRGW